METRVEEQPTFVDTAKLALAIVVVLLGLVGYYYFAESSVLLRALSVIAALAIGAGVAFTSLQGRWLWKFIQGSRVELNKVVWPTREETLQTTLIVLVVALFGGVFFWLLDLMLLWLTTRVTGQGGL
ncbi:MAG TPA: preprotein translocase subunit SecE [Gammaproteobacteria bacterium]